MIAPASLKPWTWWWPWRHASHTTPGHDCPGLIEAVVGSRLSPPWWTPLRGMIAPASLKHLVVQAGESCVCDATPGHDCPGLIEAARARGLDVRRGAPTPGHDCPGLIEAPPGGEEA